MLCTDTRLSQSAIIIHLNRSKCSHRGEYTNVWKVCFITFLIKNTLEMQAEMSKIVNVKDNEITTPSLFWSLYEIVGDCSGASVFFSKLKTIISQFHTMTSKKMVRSYYNCLIKAISWVLVWSPNFFSPSLLPSLDPLHSLPPTELWLRFHTRALVLGVNVISWLLCMHVC